jgi:hypothetical protein
VHVRRDAGRWVCVGLAESRIPVLLHDEHSSALFEPHPDRVGRKLAKPGFLVGRDPPRNDVVFGNHERNQVRNLADPMDLCSTSPEIEARERGRTTILASLTRIVTAAYDFGTFARSRDAFWDQMVELDDGHPGFAGATYPRVASFCCVQAALGFAYILDLLLIGSVAEYFADLLFPNVPIIGETARFAVPLALIGTENAIAMHLVEAQRHPSTDRGHAAMWWRLFGVLGRSSYRSSCLERSGSSLQPMLTTALHSVKLR